MTKAEIADRDEARAELRARLKPGQEILCVLRHVSRSGMQRVIDLKVIEDGEVRGLGWSAARALDRSYDRKREGITIGGCGMDMGFALVYDLGSVLWPDGFNCITPGCPSNDHSNREHNSHHRDGGYALRSRWLWMGAEPAPVVDCTQCGDELTAKKRPLCQGCVDCACAAVDVDCGICGKEHATQCDRCAQGGIAETVRKYAARRKALGLMSIDGYDAIMLMAEDLEAVHG